MFSSLLHSKDKLSWLPVVLLRQRFLVCLIEQHHTRGNEGGRIVFPKAIAGTKITHTGSGMSLLWKTLLCFLAALSATSFTLAFFSVFCTFALLLSPLHAVSPSVFTYCSFTHLIQGSQF